MNSRPGYVNIDELHSLAMANLVSRSEALNAHAAQDDDSKVNLILFQAGDEFHPVSASRGILTTRPLLNTTSGVHDDRQW